MAPLEDLFADLEGFLWDASNSEKNWARHSVTQAECEQVFFNKPLGVTTDPRHSETEARYFVLGCTDALRELAVVFTVRGAQIRVISARPMSRRERREYEQAKAAQA
ncbi:MAG: BrnT family toxin [bacterium]